MFLVLIEKACLDRSDRSSWQSLIATYVNFVWMSQAGTMDWTGTMLTNRVVGSHWRDITDLVWSGEPVCGCSLSIIWYCFIISPSCPVIRGDGETTDHWTRLCHSLSTNCREADIRFWFLRFGTMFKKQRSSHAQWWCLVWCWTKSSD